MGNTCCGCGEKGHPPTWTGCSTYKKKLQQVRENRERKLGKKTQQFNEKHQVQQRTVYKEAPRPEQSAWDKRVQEKNDERTETGGFSLKEEIRRVLGMDASNMQKIAAEFVDDYKRLSDVNDKKEALGIYFLQINKWRP